ncbi:MAG: thioredoxin family protein [Candidatus Aureabacteria bacterium]|nr:thioredoxin family protein [Candidatus Auribacterota bacterium]
MKKVIILLLFLFICLPQAFAETEPEISAFLQRFQDDKLLLTVHCKLPLDYHIYKESFQIKVELPSTAELIPFVIPDKEKQKDAFETDEGMIYIKDFSKKYYVQGLIESKDLSISVNYQGCSGLVCFLPQSRSFNLSITEKKDSPAKDSFRALLGTQKSGWKMRFEDYIVIKRITGFIKPEDFINELSSSDYEKKCCSGEVSSFADKSIWVVVLLILIGGFALNLTPCILPLIPINLAIIGAGAKARSRGQGFFTGGIYGLGMAVAYGLLGVFVVVTGSTLGTLNASPWFNAVICFIFVLLALGMFGFMNIDLTRYRPKSQMGKTGGNIFLPFFMGGIVALLAGACIAPVVLSVLLFSGEMYARGQILGLFLPFILGIGMGLPWPFAGAGLSFLPKPGRWMNYVKNGFGILILLLAVYYGYLAFRLFQSSGGTEEISSTADISSVHKGWITDLEAALKRADKENKPILIDFWASWCKNCAALEKRTLSDPDVVRTLEDFIKVKFQAENPSEPFTKEVLDHFGVKGLPTVLVIKKKNSARLRREPRT